VDTSSKLGYLELLELWSLNNNTLIFSRGASEQQVRVREHENVRWMQIGSDHIQAIIDVSQPEEPLAISNQVMLLALIFQSQPHTVLNLGLGGGSLERFFLSHFPNTRMTSVEVSETVIDIARDYFFLPTEHEVITQSAPTYMARNKEQFSIIFTDIFIQGSHPQCLFDSVFYRDCYRSLTESGVLVINSVPGSESELGQLLAALREHFDTVAIFNAPDSSNYIVFAMMPGYRHPETFDAQARQWLERFKLTIGDLADLMTWIPQK